MAKERAWKQATAKTSTENPKAPVENQGAMRAALRKIEDDWMASRLRGDAEPSKKLLDESYVGATSRGAAQTRAAFLKSIEAGPGQFTGHIHSERKIAFRGDVAISTGVATLSSHSRLHSFRYLRVFLRTGGEWSLIASQSTPLY
jgi:hypothetical protein